MSRGKKLSSVCARNRTANSTIKLDSRRRRRRRRRRAAERANNAPLYCRDRLGFQSASAPRGTRDTKNQCDDSVFSAVLFRRTIDPRRRNGYPSLETTGTEVHTFMHQ